MATHYELLNLVQGATASEVEAACEALYETYRHLVNHPDQHVALDAQRKINELDEARAVLTDPVRRSAYDAGITGATGGLVDPGSSGGIIMAPPPGAGASIVPSMAHGAAQHTATGTVLWACPDCRVENPPNTKFCLSCGAQLVRDCPECNRTSLLVATGFCGECGIHWDAATRRRALAQRRTELDLEISTSRAALVSQKQHLEGELANGRKSLGSLRVERGSVSLTANIFWGVIFGCGTIVSVVAAFSGRRVEGGWFLIAFCLGLFVVASIVSAREKSARKAQLDNDISVQESRIAQKQQQIAAAVGAGKNRLAELTSMLAQAASEFEELGRTRGRPIAAG